ncbi:hypothetical protein JJL56_31675 [Azospirillum sp. YIM DDC1]|uniref:Uncharacterized protein n=1 Tax=Azospirillum aestuarii TaxID=2802052 RepID=A0ABS1I9L7_9PROT|nr:hypothetical protein [Azospirillum aestuarii]MBK4723413.1 hypothetical protein [Azospirillum aestuarii]
MIPEEPSFRVEARIIRRGPDGSLVVYEVKLVRPFKRVYEAEVETIDDATAEAVVSTILRQVVAELGPQLLVAARGAQGRPLPGAEGTRTVQ